MAIIKMHEANGYTLLESEYPSRLRQPMHMHELASFSFVLNGNYTEKLGSRTAVRTPSTVIFHPPHESHAVDYDSHVRILGVRFDDQRFSQVGAYSRILYEASICRTDSVAWLASRIYREFRRMDAFSMLAIEGLVLELLATAARMRMADENGRIPRYLSRVKEYLHENFEHKFAFADIVRIAGVHPAHLSRVFRQTYGSTIGEYVRTLRTEHAARQVSLTAIPLGEIAHAAGFSDQSHFNRAFKQFYGMTPGRYRQISKHR